jgi:hypothetical protein
MGQACLRGEDGRLIEQGEDSLTVQYFFLALEQREQEVEGVCNTPLSWGHLTIAPHRWGRYLLPHILTHGGRKYTTIS